MSSSEFYVIISSNDVRRACENQGITVTARLKSLDDVKQGTQANVAAHTRCGGSDRASDLRMSREVSRIYWRLLLVQDYGRDEHAGSQSFDCHERGLSLYRFSTMPTTDLRFLCDHKGSEEFAL